MCCMVLGLILLLLKILLKVSGCCGRVVMMLIGLSELFEEDGVVLMGGIDEKREEKRC